MDRFPASYSEARNLFLAAGAKAGARMSAHKINAKGPDGEDLYIDVARLGAEKSQRLLVISSGTHGVEGPAGTAAQTQFLDEDFFAYSLPRDAGVLLIHAKNPFGYAWGRRCNEDNVDLNRNFLDWETVTPPARPDYASLDPLLNPTKLDENATAEFLQAAMALVQEKGEAWVQARLTEGQYQYPRGLYYGGAHAVESNTILRAIYADALHGAHEACVIDVHTGMGAHGDHLVISSHYREDPAHQWLVQHFAPARVEAVQEGDTRWPAVAGKMGAAIAAANPHCAVRWQSLEFGTYEGARMILSERAENWLFNHGDRKTSQGAAILREVWETSSPADPRWRRRVLNGARAAILDGWRGLFGADGF